MQYWLVSWNERTFRLHDYLKVYDIIDWQNKQNNKFNIDDIVYLYSSRPESRISYEMKIIAIDIPVELAIDDSMYAITKASPLTCLSYRLKLIKKITSDKLCFKYLQNNGLNCSPRSPFKIKDDLLSYIRTIIQSEQLDYDEIENPNLIFEGAKKSVIVNQYERNPIARQKCIEANGCKCKVCGMDFEEKYGEIGRGFIHVHHVVPISTIGESYQVDPIKDLVPVCPNCHAMLHRGHNGVVFTIDELKTKIQK